MTAHKVNYEINATDETRIDFYDLDLTNGMVAEVNLYFDSDYEFGPYVVTVDVKEPGNKRVLGQAWGSTKSKDVLEDRVEDAVSTATGRAVLGIEPEKQDEHSEDRSAFKFAIQSIKSKINGSL